MNLLSPLQLKLHLQYTSSYLFLLQVLIQKCLLLVLLLSHVSCSCLDPISSSCLYRSQDWIQSIPDTSSHTLTCSPLLARSEVDPSQVKVLRCPKPTKARWKWMGIRHVFLEDHYNDIFIVKTFDLNIEKLIGIRRARPESRENTSTSWSSGANWSHMSTRNTRLCQSTRSVSSYYSRCGI